MSFRLSVVRWLQAAAICALLTSHAHRAAAQAAPPLGLHGASATTNSAERAKPAPFTKKDGLTAFEEELSKSLQFLSPKSSLEGVLAPEYRPPPPTPVVPNRRPRESRDRRAEWLLMNSDEARTWKSGEDWSPLPGLEEDSRKKPSSLETMYQKFNQERGESWSGLDSLAGRRTPTERSRDRRDAQEANMPGEIRQAEDKLKKQLGLEPRSGLFEPASPRSSLGDFFRSTDTGFSSRELQAHKDYLQQYQQMLDTFSASRLANPLNAGAPAALTPAPAYRGLDALGPGTRVTDAPASARSFSSIADPVRLPDPNVVTKQWDPLYEPPKLEPTKTAPLFTPSIEAPRRRF